MLVKEHDFSDTDDQDIVVNQKSGSRGALDEKLFQMLKELRKSIAVKKNIPPLLFFKIHQLKK